MSSRLSFAEFSQQHTPAPPPRPNGGLYTGEMCAPGGGYCAVPVTPDALHLRNTLQSAAPPPGATRQPWSQPRPGNNDYSPEYVDYYGLRCPK